MPCPQITVGATSPAGQINAGMSPKGPLRCGSTTFSTKPVAAAASKAVPPASSIFMPAAVAIQWVEVTIPKVPVSSGRVVNRIYRLLLAGCSLPPETEGHQALAS